MPDPRFQSLHPWARDLHPNTYADIAAREWGRLKGQSVTLHLTSFWRWGMRTRVCGK